MAWCELKVNRFIHELTTALKIKPMLVVKSTHTELLLLSESLETKATQNTANLPLQTYEKNQCTFVIVQRGRRL